MFHTGKWSNRDTLADTCGCHTSAFFRTCDHNRTVWPDDRASFRSREHQNTEWVWENCTAGMVCQPVRILVALFPRRERVYWKINVDFCVYDCKLFSLMWIYMFLPLFTSSSTPLWQGTGHGWPHRSFRLQTCRQGGQSPKWHLCGSRFSCLQTGATLHNCLHFGGLVCCFWPHGT